MKFPASSNDCTGVQLLHSPYHDFNLARAALHRVLINVSDFELTALRGRDALGDRDDVVVVEVKAGHGVRELGLAGFSFMPIARPLESNSITP